MNARGHHRHERRRRGAVTVFVAISMVIIIGMAALAVDISSLYSAQAELQRTADAAALAAASQLAASDTSGYMQAAITAADDGARRNAVMNRAAGLDQNSDVEFGRVSYNGSTGRMTFTPGGTAPDGVRVTVRRASGSAAGPMQLTFARIFGQSTRNLQAKAAAVLVPRDMSLVVDLSGSMAWDSMLMFWNRSDGGCANTRDIWAALDGPEPHRPYVPASETASEYAADSGPTYGAMTNWGSHLTPSTYTVGTDPGLWYIRKGQTQALAAITTSLTGRHYTLDERTIIMNGSNDSNTSHWRNRCGVMLGLATWNSGRPGGHTGGNGNTTLDNSEMSWIAYPSYRASSWTWQDFIDSVQSGYSNDASVFRYYYGLKTFTEFVLEDQEGHSATSNLWATPEEPQRAIKDATQTLVNTLTAQDTLDHLSLEVFATSSQHEVNLTSNLQSVADLLYQRQAAHYDPTTNIGAGLHQAIVELSSSRARGNAKKVIILLSDGLPNVDQNGNYVGDGGAAAVSYATNMAQQAHNQGWTIYTISVGSAADRSLMQQIAAIGGGVEFYAAGDPGTYTTQLQNIFRALGGKRSVQLIE